MHKSSLFYVLILLVSMFLSSCCYVDEISEMENVTEENSAQPQEQRSIRLFCSHDTTNHGIGLYVKKSDVPFSSADNIYNNVKLSMNGNQFVASEPLLWPEDNSYCDFIAYGPFIPDVEEISNLIFPISSDQSTEDSYNSNDFIWGIVERYNSDSSESPVINMSHILSQVKIMVNVPSLDYDKLSITINNVQNTGHINLADGKVNVSGDAGDVYCFRQQDNSYNAILIPQTITDTRFITINYDDKQYTYSGSIELKPYTIHTLTISSLADNAIKLSVLLEDWELKDVTEDDCEEER